MTKVSDTLMEMIAFAGIRVLYEYRDIKDKYQALKNPSFGEGEGGSGSKKNLAIINHRGSHWSKTLSS